MNKKHKRLVLILGVIIISILVSYIFMPSSKIITNLRVKNKINITGKGTEEEPWDISADDGTSSVQAILSEEGKHLTISGIGAMKNWSDTDLPIWYENKDNIQAISISDQVTNIGDYAFYKFTRLAWITVPENVKSIGYKSLEECTNLSDLVIMPGVEEIKMRAFAKCTKLGTVSIPNTVLTIGENAFEECINLKKISVEQSNNYFCDEDGILFNAQKTKIIKYPPKRSAINYEIPNTVEEIVESAFAGCNELITVTIPETVVSIPANAFFRCTRLESIEIPSSVTNIGITAFAYCSNLSNITIKGIEEGTSKLKIIDSGAFFECTSLENIVMPASLTTIRGRAFANCTGITNIIIPEEVNIEKNAFSGAILTNRTIYNSDNFDINVPLLKNQNFTQYNCMNCELKEDKETITVFADEITYIKPAKLNINDGNLCGLEIVIYAGIDASSDQSQSVLATLENDTLVISGTGAMKNYKSYAAESQAPWTEYRTKIKKIRIEEGVTSIGTYAFSGCNSLTDIELPEGIMITTTAFDDTTLNIDWIMNQREGATTYDFRAVPDILQILGNLEDIATFEFLEYDYMSMDGGSDISNVCCSLSNFSPVASISINEGDLIGFKVKYNISWNISAQGQENNVIAKLSEDRKTLTISGHGNMKDAEVSVINENQMPWLITEDNKSITKVIIEDGVTNIGKLAFTECEKLEEISIPSSINRIKEEAFSLCSSLKSINIPASIEEISSYVFLGCSRLTNITVEDENKKYSSGDGILFNKDKTILIKYPEGKVETEYEIPSSVNTLKEGSFVSCNNLTDVIISKSVIDIEDNAFEFYNENLTIHGYKGSVAEIYATQNNIKFENIKNLIEVKWFIDNKMLEDSSNGINIKSGEEKDVRLCGIYDDESIVDLTSNADLYSDDQIINILDSGKIQGLSKGKARIKTNWNPEVDFSNELIINVCELDRLEKEISDNFQTNYKVGERIKTEGLTVKAVYTNGGDIEFKENITNYNVINSKGENLIGENAVGLSKDDSQIIISYTENNISKTINQQINIEEQTEELIIKLGQYKSTVENMVNYIENIKNNTTIQHLKNELVNNGTNGTITLWREDTEIKDESAKLETGMKMKISLGDNSVTYKIVVIGDVTGDGEIDLSDLVLLARYVAKTDKNVETIKIKAMEVNNNDGKNIVDMSDLVIMARYVAKNISDF